MTTIETMKAFLVLLQKPCGKRANPMKHTALVVVRVDQSHDVARVLSQNLPSWFKPPPYLIHTVTELQNNTATIIRA